METFFIGSKSKNAIYENLPSNDFILFDDELPHLPYATYFDITLQHINPLKAIDYKTARQLAGAFYEIASEGGTTLTVRNGRRALLKAFMRSERFDKIHSKDQEIQSMMDDILVSPVLKNVLCNGLSEHLNPREVVLIRLNRAEIGDFDAFVLGQIFMALSKGPVFVPKGDFYLRDANIRLLRENRLSAGIRRLDLLPPRLRREIELSDDLVPCKTTYDDAEFFAKRTKYTPGQEGFTDEIQRAMGNLQRSAAVLPSS